MNPNEPATKGDLAELKTELRTELRTEWRAELQAFESRLEGRLDVREQRLVEQMGQMIRDTETRLLTAFYSYAGSNDKHLAQLDASGMILQSRVATLESRMMEAEKRLNFPPGRIE